MADFEEFEKQLSENRQGDFPFYFSLRFWMCCNGSSDLEAFR